MKGQINFGVWVLITAIIAIAILLIFDSTIRSYIITNLGGLTRGITTSTGGQFSEVTTNFTAYNCTSFCHPFSNRVYSWAINFNGANYTAYLNDNISITSSPGNYSLEIYPIISPYGEQCSNITTSISKIKITKLSADKNYILYYFKC